ncbi:MAG: galactokinase [Betaproteobacteria bacterium]|nr:MAG: galactokinase [Betaproteobacteria bacterium]
MLITRTPLRISIAGGGTDLPSYYQKHGGFVISAAINRYVYIALSRSFTPDYRLKYSKLELTDTIDGIEHRIIREAFRMHEIQPGIEMVSVADVPAGTGLGSSGSFTVGLVHALHALKQRPVDAETLAKEAVEIEMNRLSEPVGKQDQYIAAYGGLTCQEYFADGSVKISSLGMSDVAVRELREGLMLFFTGYSRNASELLRDQKSKSLNNDSQMLDNLHFVKSLGLRIKDALENNNPDAFGELMHEHWLHKKRRSASMSSQQIDDAYEHGRAHGAIGGKLVGAGGGGFLLFYTRDRRRLRRAMNEIGLHEMEVGFDFDGSTVLLRG